MGKFIAFLIGVAAGFGLYHFCGQYHVLNADDGLHLVEKSQTGLADTYVDIRDFGAQDWLERPHLAAAVAKSDEGELLRDSLTDDAAEQVRKALDSLRSE